MQRQQSANSTQIANNIYAGGAGIINLESHRVWSYNQMLSKIFVDRPNIPACALYSHGSWSAPKNSLRSRTPAHTHARANEHNSKEREGHSRTYSKHSTLRLTTVVHKVRFLPRTPSDFSRPGPFPPNPRSRPFSMLKPSSDLASRRPRSPKTNAKAGRLYDRPVFSTLGASYSIGASRGVNGDARGVRRFAVFRGGGKSGCDIVPPTRRRPRARTGSFGRIRSDRARSRELRLFIANPSASRLRFRPLRVRCARTRRKFIAILQNPSRDKNISSGCVAPYAPCPSHNSTRVSPNPFYNNPKHNVRIELFDLRRRRREPDRRVADRREGQVLGLGTSLCRSLRTRGGSRGRIQGHRREARGRLRGRCGHRGYRQAGYRAPDGHPRLCACHLLRG